MNTSWRWILILLAFHFFMILPLRGQEPVWDAVITICSESYEIEAQITAGGTGGNGWFVVGGIGNGDFTPQNNRVTTVSAIGLGENWYYYDGPGTHDYYIKVIRVEPPIFALTGSETFCGSDDIITLTLSGSHDDYRYYVYRNGNLYPGAVARDGTGSSLTWDVSHAGLYTVEARMTGNESYCSLWMTGEVQAIPTPLPLQYELATPQGTDFCDGLTIPVRLADSEERVSYQLFHENEPFGGPRSGTDGSPITWNPGVEGTFYVLGTNVDTGCQSTMQNSVTLRKLALPEAFDISPVNASFCSGTGPVEISINGSQTGVNYQLRTLAGNVLDPVPGTEAPIGWDVYQSGNYSVLATREDNNCTALMIYYSNVTELITYSLAADGDPYYCQGGYGVDLRLSPSSQPGVEYILFKDGSSNSSLTGNGGPLVWANMKEGEYRVVAAKDGVQCDMHNVVTVTQHQYTGSVLPVAPVCRGEAVQLNASGGTSYSWTPAEGLSNTTIPDPVASPPVTTTYNVTITNDKGCSGTEAVTVTVHAPPVADAGSDQVICQDGSAQLHATGGGTYEWSPSNGLSPSTTIADPEASPSETTVYTVRVTNANGCQDTDQVTVTVNPRPTVNAGADKSICAGQEATLTVTGNAGSYLWSTGETVSTIAVSPSETTIYTVSGLFEGSVCESTDMVMVTVNPLPAEYAVTGSDEFCEGETGPEVGLENSETGVIYELYRNGGSTGLTVPGTTGNPVSFGSQNHDGTNTYTVVARNASSLCTAPMPGSAVITKHRLPAPAQSITGPLTICPGTPVTLSVPEIVRTDDYIWTLPPGTIISGEENSHSITVSFPSGTGVAAVTVRGRNDCGNGPVSPVKAITVRSLPAAAGPVTGTETLCEDDLNISYSTPVVAHATSYLWELPAGAVITGYVNSDTERRIIVNFPKGSSSGTIRVTPINSCGTGAPSDLFVTVNSLPNLVVNDPSGELNCSGVPVTLLATSSTPGISWAWTAHEGGRIINGSETATPVIDLPGLFRVTATANGCSAKGETRVDRNTEAPENVSITATAPIITCNTDLITLTASHTGPSTVSWQWMPSAGGNIVSGATTANPVIDKGGYYTVIITNSETSCPSEPATIFIDEDSDGPDLGGLQLLAPGQISCINNNVTLSTDPVLPGSFAAFEWTSATGTIDNTTSPTPTVNAPGIYTLIVTGQNGCTAEKEVEVLNDARVPHIWTGDPGNINCQVSQVELTGGSGTAGASWQWSGDGIIPGATNGYALVGQSGTYTLTVTHPESGCTSTETVTVTSNTLVPQLNFPDFPGEITCTNPSVIITSSTTANNPAYQWFGPLGQLLGETGPSLTVTSPGEYTLRVTDPGNNCQAQETITIDENIELPGVSVATPDVITCSHTSITLSASSPTPGVSWSWSTANGTIGSGANGPNPSVSSAGSYTVTVTHPQSGCTSQEVVTVIEDKDAPVIVNFNNIPQSLTCNRQQVQLSGDATNASLQWTGPLTAIISAPQSPNPFVDTPGTYTLTATGNNGCTAIRNVTVNRQEDTPTDLEIQPFSNLSCSNGTAALTATSSTPGATFRWEAGPGGTILTDPSHETVTVGSAATYTVFAAHPLTGCEMSEEAEVTFLSDAPVITFAPGLPPEITCSNQSAGIQLSATVQPAGSELLWSGPGSIDYNTMATPTVYLPGTYTLTARHPLTGCITSRDIEVGSNLDTPQIISFDVPGPVTCENQTIQITPELSAGTFIYQWTAGAGGLISGSDVNETVVVSASATYTLTVTDQNNGCTVSGSVFVAENKIAPHIAVNLSPSPMTCGNIQTQLYGTSTTPGAVFQWDGPGNIINATTEYPLVDQPGIYTLTVTNPLNGCQVSAPVTVGENRTLPQQPQIIAPQELTCSRLWTDIEVSPLIDNADYSWATTSGGTILYGETPSARVNEPGIYTVTVTDRVNGCTSTNFIEVIRNDAVAAVEITGGPYMLDCATASLVLAGSSAQGVDPAWTTDGGNIMTDRYNIDAEVNAPGEYTLTVHHPVSGCPSSATVTVGHTDEVPLIDVDSYPGKITCGNGTVQLYGAPVDPAHDFAWSTTDGYIVSGGEGFEPVVNQPGTYVITVTNPVTGCTSQAGIIVEEDRTEATFSIAEPDAFTCLTDYVQLKATVTSGDTDVSYEWTTVGGGTIWPGDENDANPRVTTAGTYTLTVTKNNNQCTISKYVIVGEEINPPHITTDKNPDILTCERKEVILSGSSNTENAEFNWTSPDGHTIYNSGTKNPRVNQPGKYILTVTDPANDCTATSEVTVARDIAEPHIHIEPDPEVLTCNVTSVRLEGDSNTGDVSYSWSGPVPVENSASKVVYVTEPGRYYLTVTRNATGCTTTDYVDVDRDTDIPAAPPADGAYTCFGGDPATLEAAGNKIRWYDHSNLEAGALIREGGTYTPTVTAMGNYYYYVTQTGSNGCESPSTQVKYTIRELPSSPSVVNREICEGSPNTQLRAYGSNISWYESPGGTLLSTGEYYTPDPSVNAPGTYIYYASQTDEYGCESNLSEVTFIIRAQPASPVITQELLETCAGEPNPSFTAPGKNIRWYGSATATSHLYTGNEYTSTKVQPGSYTYYVSQTSDYGCQSERSAGTLIINEIPAKFDVTGGGVFCENTAGVPVGLENSEAGVEYTLWLDQSTVTGNATGTGGGIDFGYQDIPGTYTVTATGDKGCNTEMNGAVSAAVSKLPGKPGDISGQQYVCQSSTNISYSVSPVHGASSYIWELPAGVQVSSGLGTNSITADFTATAQSGAVRVRAVNNCGQGPVADDLYVSVNHLPAAAGNIIANAYNTQVCRGDEEIVFEIPEAANATVYQWQLPAGVSVVQGEGTRMIKVRFAPDAATGDQVVMVRGENDCGFGAWSPGHTITVYAPPSVTAGDVQHLCSDESMLQGSAIPAGGSALWETVSGFAVFSNRQISNPQISSLAMGENIFAYTVTHEACSVTDTVRIYNNQVLVDAGPNRVICNEVINLDGSGLPPGTTGIWSIGAGSASFENAADEHTRAYNFDHGDNKLYWSVTKNGCLSHDSVIITNHRPEQVNAGPDLVTCDGETWAGAIHPSGGIGQWQVISGKAQFDDMSDPNTRIFNLDRGANRLAWVITNFACSLGDTITITNKEIDITAGDNTGLCDSRTTMNATPPPPGATGEWSVARGAATFMQPEMHDTRVSGLAQGENELTWTITNEGCKLSDNIILVNNSPTPANAGPNQEVTTTQAWLEANNPVIGTGTWSVISGSGSFDDPQLNSANVSNLSPGPNIFRWTISHQGCESVSDVTINNGSLETIYAGEDQVLCGNETRLNASDPPFGFGVWSLRKGSARFERGDQADTRVYDLGQGENLLRWSVYIGSTEYYDEVLIINNLPSQASAGSDRSICSDSFILTGNEPLIGTGIWTLEGGSAVIHDNSMHNTPVTELARGNNVFRWTITNENCVSSDIVVISNDIPTAPDAGPDQSTCSGSVELFPNTPTIGNGEWSVISGAGSFGGNSVSQLANGENRLRYTITNKQCSLSDDVTITNYRPTAADAGYNMSVCTGEVELNANQPNTNLGETGRWTVINGSGTFQDATMANTVVSGLASGSNVFRWTIDNQGCTSYDEIVVNYDYIEAYAGRDIITCDSELTLNANNPGNGAGEWSVRGGSGSAVFESPNSPNTRVTNLDQGNNILRWTITSNRCVSFDEITVRNNSPSPAYAGADQALCSGSGQLQARDPFIGNGTWHVINGSGVFDNEGVHNTMVSNISRGANTFRWTVENEGCISSDEVVIRNNQPLEPFAGESLVLCEDSALLAASEPEAGLGVWSIVRGAGVIEDAYSHISTVSSLAPGENVFKWTVTNGQCSDYSEVILINNKPTVASAGADRTICDDFTVLEGNIPLQGTGTWSVISGSGIFDDAGLYNSKVSGLSRGRNILRWTVSVENCTSTSDVIIQNDRPSIPVAGTDIAVCGSSAPLNGNNPAVGTGRWSLVSGTGTFDDADRYNTTIGDLGQGNNILRWTITNNLCSLSDQVEVRNNRTDVYAGPDQIVYTSHTSLSANVPARGTGNWSLDAGGGIIDSPGSHETTVRDLHEGANTFLWSVDIDGCISSDDVRITYYRQPVASFTVNRAEGCPPLEIRFTKTTTEDYPFRWELGEQGVVSAMENPVHTFESPGRYVVRLFVTGPDGKDVISERVITVHKPPVSSFELAPTELYIPGGELRTYNFSFNSRDYLWDFGDGSTSRDMNPVHQYQEPGSYLVSLRVWSAEGCADSSFYHRPVNVVNNSVIRFPSAFTPNPSGSAGGRYDRNDFSNQVFYPIIINGSIDNYKMEIYNRWGLLLFESNDIGIGWDGYYRGSPAVEDVYVYRVTGIMNNGSKFSETGDFLLMRRD